MQSGVIIAETGVKDKSMPNNPKSLSVVGAEEPESSFQKGQRQIQWADREQKGPQADGNDPGVQSDLVSHSQPELIRAGESMQNNLTIWQRQGRKHKAENKSGEAGSPSVKIKAEIGSCVNGAIT